MFKRPFGRNFCAAALSAGAVLASPIAQAQTPHINKVFVIALENHNFRQPDERHRSSADLRQPRGALHQ